MKKLFLVAAFSFAICSYSAAQTTPVKPTKTEEKTTPNKDTTAKKSTGKTTETKPATKPGDIKLPMPGLPTDTVNTVPPKSKGSLLRRK